MRYERGYKEVTRQHILDIASRRFRKHGLAEGISGIMKDAGLTHGGFYSHFQSKGDLVRESLLDAAGKKRARLAEAAQTGGFEALVREYLSRAHRDRLENSCAFAALISDFGRLPRSSRAVFTREVKTYIELIAAQLAGGDEAERRRRAMQIFGVLLGALQLARTIEDRDASDRMLEAGVEAALGLGMH